MKFRQIFAMLIFATTSMPMQAMWAARIAQSLGRTLSKTPTTAFRSLVPKRQPLINQKLSTPLSRMRSTPATSRYRFTFSTPWQRATFFAASTAAAIKISKDTPKAEQPLATSAQEIPEKNMRRFLKKRAQQVFEKTDNQFVKALAAVFYTSRPANPELTDLVLKTSKEMGIDPRCVVARRNNAPEELSDISTAYSIEPEHSLKNSFKRHVNNIRTTTGNHRLYIVVLEKKFKKNTPEQQRFIIGHELMHAHLGHTKQYEHLTESLSDRALARAWEKEADIQAARKLGCAQVAIDHFKTYLSPQELAELQTGTIKQADANSTHPTFQERIAYLQPIAQEQAKTQALR